MGVLYDYYRATSRQAAVVKPEKSRVVNPAWDVVDAKGIDPVVILGQLIAFIRDVPYDMDLVRPIGVYPPPESAPRTEEEWEALPEDSLYLDGPDIDELPAHVRDSLASVPDDRLDELVEQWGRIEEFSTHPADDGYLLEVLTGLRALAQRAQKEDELIYCWISL